MGRPRTLTDDQRLYNHRRSHRVNQWKHVGLKLPEGFSDYTDFHDRHYLGAKTCDGPGDGSKCTVVFKDPGPTGECGGRDMEHCHDTKQFRGVCCRTCNILRRYTLDGEVRKSKEERLSTKRAFHVDTPEEIAAKKAAHNARRRARHAARTPAQVAADNAKQCEKRARRSPEKKAADNAKQAAKQRERRAAEKAAASL